MTMARRAVRHTAPERLLEDTEIRWAMSAPPLAWLTSSVALRTA